MDIVLGVDLGINKMGLCECSDVRSESRLIAVPEAVKKANPGQKRLSFIKACANYDGELQTVMRDADLIVIEVPFNVPGWGKILVEVLGIVKFLAVTYKKPFAEVPQATLKLFACERGNAEKSQMVLRAHKEFNFEASTEDEIDAFWLAQLGRCLTNPEGWQKWRTSAIQKIQILKP